MPSKTQPSDPMDDHWGEECEECEARALRSLLLSAETQVKRRGMAAEATARNLATASCATEREFRVALRRGGVDANQADAEVMWVRMPSPENK